MTDYLYSLSLATQTKNFLLSLGVGFVLGLVYDVYRIIRLSISSRKAVIIVFDIFYCITFCLAFFVFLLTVNEGQFRIYLLLGTGIGFSVYYFSLGVIIFSFSEFLTEFIKKWIKRVFTVFLFPFKWIFSRTKSLVDKKMKKSRKTTKKLKNKSKTLLKLNKHLLYNLNVKKRVRVDDASEKRRSGKIMANTKTKAPKRKQKKSFILTLGIILLVGYFVITIIGLQLNIRERQDVLEQKNSVYEEQLEQNKHLQSIVDSDDKSEYLEQIAREKLGFIMPGEKVFYDVTPGV